MAKRTPKFIDPDVLYDYTDCAEILQKTPNWLKKNFILTGKVDVVPAGNTYWILGYAMIAAVRSMQINIAEEKAEENEEDESQSHSREKGQVPPQVDSEREDEGDDDDASCVT